jgi:hypothetical protein
MIIVTDFNGNSEIVNKFNNFEMCEELNGSFTITFTSYRHVDNPGHDLIMEEGLVEYDGYKFRIKQLRKQTNSIQVSGISTYYDNADIYKYDIYGGTRTLSEFMTYILTDTGWTWSSEGVDLDTTKLIPNFGQNNVIRLMDALKSIFEFEVRIDRGNAITISDSLGPDNDSQYRYGHNIISLTESVDTTKLKTYVEGFGANGLHVTYTSPYSSTPGIGIRHAEPIFEEDYDDADALTDYIKSQLHDYPDSIVELDDAVLMDKEIGEKVWLIHERMGIEYQTRVVARRIKIPNSLSSVILGTYQPQSRSIGNILATQRSDIDRNNSVTRSRFDQTNSRIDLEVTRLDGVDSTLQSSISVEAGRITQEVTDRQNGEVALQASITLEADRITQEVTDRTSDVSTLQASIVVESGRITQEVSDRTNGDTEVYTNSVSLIEQTATSIRSEVSTETARLDGRVDSAESSIEQTATAIRSEVSTETTRLDGRVDATNSLLDQEVADRSSGDTVVYANAQSLIEQTATSILSEVSTEVGRLDGRVDTANSSIEQTATEIRSEVSTEVTRIDGRVDSANSLISQQADEILLRVTKDGIISAINLTSEAVRISASKINLSGAVTISDLDSSVSGKVTKLNNSGIYTGTIDADQINTVGLSAEMIYQADNPNNYAEIGGDFGDLVLFYNLNEYFRIYNSFSLMQLKFKGAPFLQTGNSGITYPKGSWDFTDLTSLTLPPITAKFA